MKEVILSDSANEIATARYFGEDEDWKGAIERVVDANIQNEMFNLQKPKRDILKSQFFDMIHNQYFIPGGRILRNSGRKSGSMMNCYVLRIDDSIEKIGEFYKNCLILWSEGGGVGASFSNLRPRGDVILGKGGSSSGLVSFLIAADNLAKTIESGGGRRAAGLALVDVSHPEIIDFIDAKLELNILSSFNISVGITNSFLEAVERDDDWDLTFNKKIYKTIKARFLWDKILKNMIKSAEPGLLNLTNLMKNNSYSFAPIECFAGDTLVSTTKGLIKIEDLVNKEVDIISDLRTIGSQGTFIEKGKGFESGKKEVFEVKLQNNQTIKITENQQVWTTLGWKPLKELKIKEDEMYVQNSISQHLVGNMNNKEEFNDGYFLGLLVGDGWITQLKDSESSQYGFCFNEQETEMMDFVKTKINNISESREINWNKSTNSKSYELSSSEKNVNEYFTKWGYCCKKNKHGYISGSRKSSKFISDEVLIETPSFKRGFISGLFSTDGYVAKVGKGKGGDGKQIVLSTSKKHMAEKIQIMLNEFGIISSLGSGHTTLNDKLFTIYRVKLNRTLSCMAFKELIGVENSVKNIELDKYNFGGKWQSSKYGMFKVKSIKSLGEQKVYDIETNITHSFIANGMIVHNCTNPCGEIPLSDGESCCLGSLVLPNFITGSVNTNWKKLEQIINLSVRFLDNVLDINKYVLPKNDFASRDSRKIGLGVIGLADYLFAKKVRYGSEKALNEIEKLFKFIRDCAYKASIKLAQEKGAFPKFDAIPFGKASFVRKLPATIRMDIKKYGIRNCTILTCAPTGCLIPESKITTTEGIKSLDNIFKENDIDLSKYKNQSNIWIVPKKDIKANTINGPKKITNLFINGNNKTKKIILVNGIIIEGTYNHKILIYNKSLKCGEWKRLDELKYTDMVIKLKDDK